MPMLNLKCSHEVSKELLDQVTCSACCVEHRGKILLHGDAQIALALGGVLTS